MKNFRSYKTILLILLICFPVTILFSMINADVSAKEYVPEEHNDNRWHWHDDIQVDDIIVYEIEVMGKNLTGGNMVVMSKELRIYNITGFSNDTSQFGFGDISYINGTWNYYNCTSDKIIPNPYPFGATPHNIAGFGFNNSGTFSREYYEAEVYSINCIFLPINGSNGLEVDVMANIINKTYFDLYSQAGYSPRFDYNSTKIAPDNNNIYFEDTSSHYFINNTYYDNGTLRYYEGSYFIASGPNTVIEYNFTQKIVVDYNITDEIEWSVDVGDTLYYGWNTMNDGYNETKLVITGFENDMGTVLGSMGPLDQCFESVLANRSYWDPILEEYVLEKENFTIGKANNFYPLIFGKDIPLLVPENTEKDDIEFYINNYTYEVQGGYFFYDDIYITSKNGKLELLLKASMDNDIDVRFVYDEASGISDFLKMKVKGLLDCIYRKNMTIVTNQAEAESVLLYSDLVGNNDIYMNFTYILNEDFELYWATIPVNPALNVFPYEIPDLPLYVDVYGNLSGYHSGKSINITIHYDDSGLTQSMEEELAFYIFNPLIEKQWVHVPEGWYILDTNANTIVFIGVEDLDLTQPHCIALGIEEWAWGVDVNDIMPFEVIVEAFEIDTLDRVGGFLDFWIFNITSMEDETKDWLGEPHQTFSQVNFTWMYYNHSLGRLSWNPSMPFGNPAPLMEFCDNSSSMVPLKFGDQNPSCGNVPYILPLTYGKLNLSILAPILNETYFAISSIPPKWDVIIADDDDNTLFFYNSTHGYFMDLTYFENGTLKKGKIFYTQGGTIIYNSTITRRGSYNVTDDVKWSVKVGDDLYFGDMDKEIRFHIVEINETAVNMYDIYAIPFESIMTFSNVWADIYYWNSTHEYWMYQYRSIVGAANNLYPFGPGDYHSGLGIDRAWPTLLIPIGIDGYEMLNALKSAWSFMKVDTISGIGANYIYLTNSTGPHNLNFVWNESTGVVKLFYGFTYNPFGGKEEYVASFAKNMTVLPLGNYIFDLDNYFVPDTTFTINITTNSPLCEFYYAILDINPTNESLPIGTPLFYGDMMINDHTLLADNFTIKVKLPLTLDLDDINLHLAGWFQGSWQTMSLEAMNMILTYNYTDNSVIAEMNGEIPFYSIGAWSYTLKPPGVFTLTSTAEDPDDDGDFTLTWGISYLATKYSVFEYSSYIDETNIHLATALAIDITSFLLPLENYTDGTYYFIVRAQNADESTLSNNIQVVVELPGPPESFSLSSNAGTPDDDGDFTLTWGAAVGAVSYSVYEYSGYITVINSSLTTLATDITSLSRSLSGYSNGTYYFIVVARNTQGDTLSNCHAVIVAIPPEEPSDGDGAIPGYPLYLLLTFFIAITVILIRKKHGKLPKF